jgi:hypothetical protein
MAIGNYNTSRPATVDPADVEIFYTYTPNRETKPTAPVALDAASMLELQTDETGLQFAGLYNLRLPNATFNTLGIYHIFVRPRQIRARIVDCAALAAIPDHKGIVLDASDFPVDTDKLVPGGLQGYRVEYIDGDTLRQNYFTVVAWSNRSEVVAQNIGNTTQKARAYRYNNVGSLLFLSLTPSTSHSTNQGITPYLGVADQEIILSNPYFDAVSLEVELVEYDLESLAIGIYGNQTRSVADGVITTYKEVDGTQEIYNQQVVYEIKEKITNKLLYEVREKLPVLDDTKQFEDITVNGIVNPS